MTHADHSSSMPAKVMKTRWIRLVQAGQVDDVPSLGALSSAALPDSRGPTRHSAVISVDGWQT